jgi:3-oxoacyl-[acyl-carrier-protein] synthase II
MTFLLKQLDVGRAGILVGTGMGGLTAFSDAIQNLTEKGYKRVSPFFIPYSITNMASALLAMDVGFMGPNYSISTACATSNYCFYAAANHIRRGDADVIVAGGTEAAILPIGLGGFVACRALSQRNDDPVTASRPWDAGRDGFVMGEGAGVLVCVVDNKMKIMFLNTDIWCRIILVFCISSCCFMLLLPFLAGHHEFQSSCRLYNQQL